MTELSQLDLPFELDVESFLAHGAKPSCVTKVTYMYRDAANYKTMRDAFIAGCVEPNVWLQLSEVLFDGTDILPVQLGLTALCPRSDSAEYDDEIDHNLHELIAVEWEDGGVQAKFSDVEFETNAKDFAEAVSEIKGEGDWNFEQYGV